MTSFLARSPRPRSSAFSLLTRFSAHPGQLCQVENLAGILIPVLIAYSTQKAVKVAEFAPRLHQTFASCLPAKHGFSRVQL